MEKGEVCRGRGGSYILGGVSGAHTVERGEGCI